MKNDRRNFLKIASLSAAATTVFPHAFALTAPRAPAAGTDATVLIGLSAASFKPWIGSRFGLVDYSSAHLVLTNVDEQAHSAAIAAPPVIGHPAHSREINYTVSFSLRFQIIGMARQLRQDTYLLSHNGLGRFPLFLVPSGDSASSTCSAQFSAPPARGFVGAPLPVRLPRAGQFTYRGN